MNLLDGLALLARLLALGQAAPRRARGGRRRRCGLRRRPSGGRSGSWPRRAPSGGCPASACGPALPRTRSGGRCCRPGRPSRSTSTLIIRISPEGSLTLRVLALARHDLRRHARRRAPSCRPGPGVISMLWIGSPSGICASGSALPGSRLRARAGDHRAPRPSARAAPGCSASRRPRSAAGRCAPTGSDRTRSPPPWPECPCLSRLKSMMPVAPLVPAAAVAHRDAAVRVAARRSTCVGSSQRLLRLAPA